jgi:RNA polymerase sigma-70 factor, ECF subfamily
MVDHGQCLDVPVSPAALLSARADLLSRLGRDDEARHSYERALALTTSDAERRFLQRRIAGSE